MKPILWVVCIVISFRCEAQDTLKVVNWNLEYFGVKNQNPPRQLSKTLTIMQQLQADVYALQEVVHKDSLKKLTQLLGSKYDYLLSTYGSLAPDTSSAYYPGAQKLAFIYNKDKMRILHSRAYMEGSATAYYNFASGRTPLLVKAEVQNAIGQWIPLDFYNIHAKAMSDNQSCQRRTAGALEWKDSLDNYEAQANFILLGDFNDDFDHSICGGNSNYTMLLTDSSGSHYYYSPTLSISQSGQSSTVNYPSLIDHVILSDEVKQWYVASSAKVFSQEVKNWVSSYADDVSDHYPVITKYILPSTSSIKQTDKFQSSVHPNPADQFVEIICNNKELLNFQIIDAQGKVHLSGNQLLTDTKLDLAHLPNGLYLLNITSRHGHQQSHKLLVLH